MVFIPKIYLNIKSFLYFLIVFLYLAEKRWFLLFEQQAFSARYNVNYHNKRLHFGQSTAKLNTANPNFQKFVCRFFQLRFRIDPELYFFALKVFYVFPLSFHKIIW